MSEKKVKLILGIRGTGKSTLAKELIDKFDGTVIIYDTLCEHTSGIICEDLQSFCLTWEKCYGKKVKIIYQPVDPEDEFGEVCELVYDCGNVLFLVEEVDTFLSLNPSGLDRRFLNIIQRGRHRDIEFIGVTQRPYTMPAILRSQCKELYTFRQFEQRDIEWLRQILGDRADEVKTLPQFEYVSFIDGSIDKGRTGRPAKAVSDMPA